MPTSVSVTTTYSGEFAGKYVSAALLSGSTIANGGIEVKPNVKFKEVIKKVATDAIVKDATCDFDATSTVTLTERILQPEEFQVNLQLCKTSFKSDWEAVQMGYSAFDSLPPAFADFLLAHVASKVAEKTEQNIWRGVTANAGEFNGFSRLLTLDAALPAAQEVAGTTVTALVADIVEFSHSEPAVCTFEDADPISWVQCGTGVRGKRTLKLKSINRPDCDAEGDRLSDIETAIAGVDGIILNSLEVIAGTSCADDYTVEQWSNDCFSEEDCASNVVTFNYTLVPAFENRQWEELPVVSQENANRKCGIRVTAGYIDPKFGDCSFDPLDYYETEPIKLELSLLNEDEDRCDVAYWPTVLQTRVGQIGRQSGEYVVREVIMKTDAYVKHIDQFSMKPRDREAFDQNLLSMVDRNAMYTLYYVTYKASYGKSYRKNEQEKFTTVFAFKNGDAAQQTFKTSIVDVLTAKSGVSLEVNS